MKKQILDELTNNQLIDTAPEFRLSHKDLTRVVKKINTSIFGSSCCLWKGYVTNLNNPKRGRYVNFYFNKKKRPLHRLIYNNFKGELKKGEYLKFGCCNKGYCLNINHMDKVYNTVPSEIKKEKKNIYLPKSTNVTFE